MTQRKDTCSKCGCRMNSSSEGLCPACLLMGVLEHTGAVLAEVRGEPPRMIEQYEIIDEIARGGMGVVYRATDTHTGRTVAIKMLAAAHFAGPDELRRFRQEAEAAARLEHPNVIPVYEVGEFDGVPFFVMKLAEGTLREHPAPVANRTAAMLLLRVANAVQFAHEHGVLHRDLKPANILLDGDDSPMVCDFGLAQLRGQEGFTLTGTGIGTPAYMAPEQASGGSTPTTTLTDVYGLGALLYHQLTGVPPFAGADMLAILRQLASDDPPHPGTINERADGDLAEVALKAMSKKPGDRYRSAASFADDLERWLRGEPTLARPAGTALRIWKWARRKPATAFAAAVSVVGAAVLTAVVTHGEIAVRHERNLAIAAENKSRKEARHAQESERLMRLNLYAADIQVASRALSDGHLGLARETLERQRPKPGQEDLRGFEWFAYHADCRGDDLHVMEGHTKVVNAVAFSPDGKTIASGGRDGLICFWDIGSGEKLRSFPRADSPTGAMEIPLFAKHTAVSPDARALLASSPGMFDAIRMRWRPSKIGSVESLAWSPDGRWLVSGGEGSYLRVWDAATGDMAWFAPVMAILKVEFSADGQFFVATQRGSQNHTPSVLVYDFEKRALLRTVEHVRECFALSQGNLIIAMTDGTMERQTLTTGTKVSTFTADDSISDIAAAAQSPIVVTLGGGSATISLWDTERGTRLNRFTNPSGEQFRSIALAPDGRTLAAVGADHLLRLVDVPSMVEKSRLRGHGDEIINVRFSPAGSLIATAGNDHTVRLWAAGGTMSPTPSGEAPIAIAEGSPTSAHALFQHKDGTVECWNASTRHEFKTPSEHSRAAAGFAVDGNGFLTTRRDTQGVITVENWSFQSEQIGTPRVITPTNAGMTLSAVSSSGDLVAVSDGRKTIELFSLKTGAPRESLECSRRSFSRMGFSPDGRFLTSFNWPDRVNVWDVQRGVALGRRIISQGSVSTTAVSPDSRLIAGAGDDNLITIQDLATGEVVVTLRAHKAQVRAVAFSPDGRTLASASSDHTLRLWHVPTWRELGVFKRDVDFTSLAFTGNPVRLIAVDYDRRTVFEGAPGESTLKPIMRKE